MAPISWKPEFSVGDEAVDHEHRELIDLVNTAAAAILDGHAGADVDKCLGDLYQSISAHFAHEERQMKRADYDQFKAHKGSHEYLLDELRDIMDGAMPSEDQTAERLTQVLEAWFTDHFRDHDARLHNRLGPHHH
ncbi:bacteriohemerythrin [Roseovarius amoyensis]|uniref:bacteriohemerythrin n=1 Tax=Roseovarius amoyensis TaxID=2211448 RepID=UPI000DBE74A1|nr:hemerythrin family protein [Roseovarius amoyensis]